MSTPKFQAVLALLTRFAGRLDQVCRRAGNAAPRIALELMNEPEISAAATAVLRPPTQPRAAVRRRCRSCWAATPAQPARWRRSRCSRSPATGADLYHHDYSPWHCPSGCARQSGLCAGCDCLSGAHIVDAMNQATDQRIAALGLTGAELDRARQARQTLASYVGSG